MVFFISKTVWRLLGYIGSFFLNVILIGYSYQTFLSIAPLSSEVYGVHEKTGSIQAEANFTSKEITRPSFAGYCSNSGLPCWNIVRLDSEFIMSETVWRKWELRRRCVLATSRSPALSSFLQLIYIKTNKLGWSFWRVSLKVTLQIKNNISKHFSRK